MIFMAEGTGVAIEIGRCGMRELGSAEAAGATTPALCPDLLHRPVRFTEPEGAVAQMMPWSGPLWSTHDRVSFSTPCSETP